MTEESHEAKETRLLTSVLIRDIPEEDWQAFREVMKGYGFNKASAFRALLDAYYVTREIGTVHALVADLQQRVAELEGKPAEPVIEEKRSGTKTFGGGEI